MQRLEVRTTITLIVFMAVFAMAARAVVDTDLYWHLAAGRYIVETGTIPTTDPFSWTMAGRPWVDVYWLAQIGWYVIHQTLGMAGLSLLVAGLATLGLALVWRQLDGPVFGRALILILAAAVSGPVWTARPHLLTYVLTAATAYVLYLYKWKQTDRLWVLPLLYVAWVNLHGGYVAGFMLLGAFLIGEGVSNIWHVPGAEIVTWPRLRKVVVITALSGAALLINPQTVQAVLLPLKTAGLPALQTTVEEWASPDFHQLFQQPMLWLLLGTLVMLGWSGRRLDVTDALTLAVFAYIALLARRNVGLFALVAAPILSRHAAAWWNQSRWSRRRLSRGQPGLNALIVILVGGAALLKVLIPLSPAVQQQAERQALPIGVADWLAARPVTGRLFNSYNLGGYLMWRLWPDRPVYVDGRTDLYDGAFLQEYAQLAAGGLDAPAIFDERGIDVAVLEPGLPLARQLAESGRWREAYQDELTIIYVPK